jgi:deoxyribonuclease IV
MAMLGAHMSIAGGYYKAAEAAAKFKMDCVQLFTKNNNQWRAKEIADEEAERFAEALAQGGVTQPLSHSSYLINLAAPDDALWQKSIDAMVVELQRAEQLGIAGVVMHPGAYTTSSEAEGLERIAAALDEIHAALPHAGAQVLLENTAGQGTCLGCDFDHLGAIVAKVRQPDRLGVCIDTCHAFAAGYPLIEKRDYNQTFAALDRAVGLDRIRAFHLNDSKKEFGSRVDRHEHIGRGKLGLEPFRHLLNDRRFRQIPMYLETPKGVNAESQDGEEWDATNLRVLRGLVNARQA